MITVLSLSGGKDSTAAGLFLREQGIDHVRVFNDTGWEHQALYDHLDYLEEQLGPIIRISGLIDVPEGWKEEVTAIEAKLGRPSAMVRWVIKKAIFPSRVVRFCTQELKVKPFLKWAREQDDDILNVVGIRAEESAARAGLAEREAMPGAEDIEVWRPLIRWTLADVVDIHARHNVLPCRLYLEGATRVGCWPCIMANKAELAMLGKDDARVDVIRDLEALVGKVLLRRKHDYTDKNLPSFFQSRAPDENKKYPCVPIDNVLEWARTAYGGRQFELFASNPADAGCMRWGMCDTGGEP
jgi:3'-phosphoadenosine 5'-phosphosulfate sulfotransferase (PAPS reductase)/FAD synthetase